MVTSTTVAGIDDGDDDDDDYDDDEYDDDDYDDDYDNDDEKDKGAYDDEIDPKPNPFDNALGIGGDVTTLSTPVKNK